MSLLPRYGAARAAVSGAARLAVTGAGLAAAPALVGADLLGATVRTSARTSVRTVRAAADLSAAVAGRSAGLARSVAAPGVRAVAAPGVRVVGRLVTGADPLPTGHVRELAGVVRGMFEPPQARRTPRVWAGPGVVQVEVPEPAPDAPPDAGRALRERLEGLEGVRWAAVNEVVGRVLVAVDERRVGVDDVVGTVGALHEAVAGDSGLPEREDHPADLEPVLAALTSATADLLAVGVAALGRVLPVPPLSRHVTLALPLLDAQDWLTTALTRRIGGVGTGLAFDALSAGLHALTQSSTVPALNAVSSLQQALEARARRQVWCRREEELCRPHPDEDPPEAVDAGPRPEPLPPGVLERYRARLGPATTAAALAVLALTRRPGRAADLVKALSPKAALQGRESFAATLDLLLCRAGVLPMDGSVYRRLDRVDCVVVDGAALCTGPPVVLEATAEADEWDDARVWTAASRLLDADGGGDHLGDHGGDHGGTRLGPPRPAADGGQQRTLYAGRRRVGTVLVAPELDPHAEALLSAAVSAGHLLVLTAHAGARELAGMAGQVETDGEPLAAVVRRLQGEGHGVLLVSALDPAALLAADVGVAPVGPGRTPAWGADLLTGPGLAPVCRVVAATADARAVSRRSVQSALTGNVLGTLLAAVGSPLYGQRKATTPGKTATVATLLDGAWTAVRVARRPDPAPSVHTPWHALDPDDVVRRLAALPAAPEPRRRRPVPGAALLRGPARFARTVAAELADPLTPVLGAGAGATAVLGESADAVLVGSVTVVNALLGALQRVRAETALESLLLEQDVRVRRERDGGVEEVPAGELRVGDVVVVSSGDVVAADARLLAAEDLEVDESSLTGESLAVAKSVAATPGADVADRRCVLFDGTTVVAGSGRAVVVAVGSATQAGRATRAAGGGPPPAGVQTRLAELTRSVLPLTLAGGAAVTALGVLWRRPLREAVGAGVAVAVAAVPEGLPLVATVAQQAAARRLSGRGAVVRSARVLEALGRVDTVCFDKTGTLTENRLQVVRLVPLDRDLADDDLLALAAAAVGAGDDEAHETDRAVVTAARDRGVAAGEPPEASVPFATGRGLSAALRGGRLVVKGAPEVVLRRCTDAGGAAARVQELACAGLRVLAVADRAVDGRPDDLEAAAEGLTLRGLVGLADTVRPSSAAAVEQLRAAGVRVLVATGDHPETAAAIAAQAGVPDADRVVTGAQLARASEAERARLVAGAAVFARLSPEQKVLLVGALRRAGATLAMTGDGVNDAAAIRLADVGVGVAGAESPAARSAADLVVTDADLTRLVDAVAEGRALWSRVRDAVAILVGGNAGEVGFTVLGTAFGGRSPLGTRQLLLVNLLTDMFPALAVAVAAPRTAAPSSDGGPLAGHPLEAVLTAGPQRGFTASVRELVAVRGVATAAGATGAWATGRLAGRRHAGTMGLAALIATQLGQTAWSGRRSPLVLATAAGSLLALAAVVQTPGVSRFFGCRPLDPLSWLVVLAWAAAGTAGAELLRTPAAAQAVARMRSSAASKYSSYSSRTTSVRSSATARLTRQT
ncbi:cation-transporting ATPase I [Geodermatophilus dictyosporus]|uniref:Cation-transporting ATPase I n=1 Tax=Geodermatophilus dictyosporus TaxID=1523247 RepID=A0A1I5JIC9_9ACTN|nr:HAD-IC family P-type ATPase [Geodermatophilus dictyosporus]SFO72303.1 cation-transporting ATPase I [Geodermatophilus dictyosporus]